jgi:uncharacterized protein (TIGR02453 family)
MPDGFNERTVGYLAELRARNDREWYYEHKPDYEKHVLKPFQALVTALSPLMARIDPDIVTVPAVGKTISRVYRDARFSRDKSLYRDCVWISFARRADDAVDIPSFYFEFKPSGYSYGAGYYNVSPKTMERFRAMIDGDEEGFLRIIEPIVRLGVLKPYGDFYKRGRYGGGRAEIAEWYNRKNIYVADIRDDISEAYDFGRLASLLEDGFESLSGIYHFWRRASFG